MSAGSVTWCDPCAANHPDGEACRALSDDDNPCAEWITIAARYLGKVASFAMPPTTTGLDRELVKLTAVLIAWGEAREFHFRGGAGRNECDCAVEETCGEWYCRSFDVSRPEVRTRWRLDEGGKS